MFQTTAESKAEALDPVKHKPPSNLPYLFGNKTGVSPFQNDYK